MKHSTFSIAFLSGKGGVGKSNIALNTAYALYQKVGDTLLMDCDLGLANLDVLLGITPEHSLQEMLTSHQPAENCLVSLAAPSAAISRKLDFLPTESGLPNAGEMDSAGYTLLCEQINRIAEEYDYLLLDVGAGISSIALNFGAQADMRAIILTPEPTSLTDGYALMKVMSAERGITTFHVIINQAESHQEAAQTFDRLSMVCEKFLNFKPELLGVVRSDSHIQESVIKQRPLMLNAPESPAAVDILSLTSAIWGVKNRLPKQPEGKLPLTL